MHSKSLRFGVLSQFDATIRAEGYMHIAGVDEAGAGPLAGPVVAAAVILPPEAHIPGIDDSKRLTERQRTALNAQIFDHAVAWALGLCSAEEIDTMNIYQASREAMRRAVEGLAIQPDCILVDARTIPNCTSPQRAIIKGDATSLCIAAASIVAKVARDTIMMDLAAKFPIYGFERHKGYGTAVHMEALRTHGPCEAHRRSFAPVRDAQTNHHAG